MIKLPTILIVEDQALIRMGIKNLIIETNSFSEIYEAHNVSSAIVKAQNLQPDIILMDLQLGDGTGAEACRIILDSQPKAKVLFLSMYDNKTSVLAAFLSGAIGYLNKNTKPETLKQAVILALKGFAVFNQKSIKYFLNISNPQNFISNYKKLENLSHQQLKVIEFVSQGLTNKEIARKMNLSNNTIRNYLTIIFEKLGISKRTEAAVFYTETKTDN